MTDQWRFINAEDFCVSVRDGTHDSPQPVESGQHLVTSRHIVGGKLDLKKSYLVSQEDFDAINKRSKVDRWDVLISMIGTVGEACLVSDEPNFAIKNVGLFKTHGEIQGKWIYYYLRSDIGKQLVREQSRGTTQQYIPLNALRKLPVFIPGSMSEMLAITNILGSFDEKIELNHKMNETLESMARAIFKSWFVDFDPVRAKAEGRETGLPKHLTDLFPNRFEESELGKIPAGWMLRTVGDIAEIVGGSTPSTKENSYWENGVHSWATPKDLSGLLTPVLLRTERRITEKGLSQISSGLLPVGTVLLSSRAPIGYIAIAEVPVAINQGFIAMKARPEISALLRNCDLSFA